MTNTTMPAESLGALPSTSSFYRWEVAEKPIAVNLSLELIDRLEKDVLESFRAVTKRGSEIGGVLAGRIIPGNPRTVTIEHFEPVECDYSRSNLYILSDEDKVRLSAALERARKLGGGLSVTGFFRSNARRDLVLDEDDLALASEYFSDPSHVMLLVRPYAMKPSAGGFFLWEQGKIRGESSYLQFPFKRSELEKNHADRLVGAPQVAVKEPLVMPRREEPKPVVVAAPPKREEPAPEPAAVKRDEPKPAVFRREEPKPAPPPPAAAMREDPIAPTKRDERPAIPVSLKREERPAIVPVAPKREERFAGPTLVTKREEPAAAKKEEKPPAPPVVAKREERPPITVRREEKPAVTPVVTKREEPAPAPVVEKPVAVKTEAPAPAVDKKVVEKVEKKVVEKAVVGKKEEVAAVKEEAAAPAVVTMAAPSFAQPSDEAEPGLFSRMKWVIVAALLAIVLVGGYFGYQAMRSPAGEAAKPADSSLALKVERNAGQLLLTWNRASTLISSATRATLSITDGDHKEDVDLDLGQLRSGSVFYSPMTNDVSFRLEISDVKNGKSLAESVRVLAGRPSPTVAAMPPSAMKTATDAADKPGSGVAAQPVNETPAPPVAPAAVEQPKVTAGPAVTAAPPKPASLAARLRAPEPQDLPAPPTLESSGSVLSGSAPASSTSLAAPPPTAPRQEPAQTAKPAAQPSAQAAQTPVQQPAPTAPVQVAPAGGRASEARLIKRVSPNYPVLARQTRVSGIVRVRALVGKDGKVKKVSALSGPPMLRQAATDAVRLWIYAPAMLNGEPTDSETQVDVSFMM